MSRLIEADLENDNAFSFEMASIFDEIREQNKECYISQIMTLECLLFISSNSLIFCSKATVRYDL